MPSASPKSWRPSPTKCRNVSRAGWRCSRPRTAQFTDEQVRWLESIRDHIAGSVSMDMGDFEYAPFSQQGGLGKAYELFGDDLPDLLEELNLKLIA